MTFGKKIKKLRKTFDLSQEELAEKMNVSRQVITKWENDGGMPEITNLKKLAELFGVSVDYLLDNEKEIEYPLLKEQIVMDKKNNYSNRFDYVVDYLNKDYGNKGVIYSLTEVGKETSTLTDIVDFLTFGISSLSYYTEWFSNPSIWFLVEMENKNLIIRATKETIETRELPSSVDKDKFTFGKVKLLKLKNKLT